MTITLSDKNEWKAMVRVPIYDGAGEEITYTWKEHEVVGYKEKEHYTQNNVTTFVNTPYDIPEPPIGEKKPRRPGKTWSDVDIEDYKTALGLETVINHAGDCFD